MVKERTGLCFRGHSQIIPHVDPHQGHLEMTASQDSTHLPFMVSGKRLHFAFEICEESMS